MLRHCECDAGAGFRPNYDQEERCEDVNECLIDGLCRHPKCSNTAGSYACGCDKDHYLTFETIVF